MDCDGQYADHVVRVSSIVNGASPLLFEMPPTPPAVVMLARRRRKADQATDVDSLIKDLSELNVGDPVVHSNHGIGRYQGSLTSTKLKVTGIDLFSAGDFQGGEGTEEIVMSDPSGGVYKKLVLKDDKLVGACLYGDTVDGSWYFKLLRDGRTVNDIRDKLMFGESNMGDAGHQGQNKAAAMADTDEVCGCNGVTKGAICKAIKDKGLFTLDEVRKQTKASASCGSCTGLVEQILMFTAGGDYSATPKLKPMCGCTEHGHQAVRDAIRQHKLLTVGGVFKFMDWRTPNGCASCRPAVNYYLISTWPKEAQDDPQSRYINERSHANIQKDGTYSVIPRMWAGETTAAELRRIADVVDKYQIPTVKVTGGQRIDLLGVKKEDLVGVRKDIGMPCGHAYAKALRTVPTEAPRLDDNSDSGGKRSPGW